MRRMASLSVDLDNLWSYQKTHGDPGWESHPSFLDRVVPRILDVLGNRHLTITFFVVGQDAELASNRSALQRIVDDGHELASHSFRHEPWLHLYGDDELDDELRRTEQAIAALGGSRPVGFRGPGYSLSPGTLLALGRRSYRYDASTLPTVIGPLARAYYLRSAHLTPSQRKERSHLFGSFRDGVRPIAPYRWSVGGHSLIELPVTTMPVLRIPIHVSYLVYIAEHSPRAALAYFQCALALCRRLSIEPSILLHPLDFLGGDDIKELAFFPGMAMPSWRKQELVDQVLTLLAASFDVVSLLEHVSEIERRGSLRTVPVEVGR
jgi:hypothetical protein